MQNFISTFSPSKSFQFVIEQLSREQESIHRHDCHSPPHTPRVGLRDNRSPPRSLPWVVGPDLWNNSSGGDYLPSASTAAIHWFPPIW
jgi:hypothetical protein